MADSFPNSKAFGEDLIDFETIKTKYVDDMKKGIKYSVVEEKRNLINKDESDLISKAINMFGEDLVDIE